MHRLMCRNVGVLRARSHRQRGIAIVTVLLVVALAAALAASVLWRQHVATHDVENQRLATQGLWVERAAVEWARATVREDARSSNVTYVGQAWSSPVSEVQLVDLLPRDAAAVNGELARAWISGQVEDAQAKFNVMNIVARVSPGQPYAAYGPGVLAYRRLLSGLGLSPALAQQTADYLVDSLRPTRGGNWPLQPVTLADLARIPGYDAHTVETLAPYATILPDQTTVNANTAAEPALMAAIPTLSHTQAQRLVERRATAYFNSTADIAEILLPVSTNATLPEGAIVGVTSGYFLVHCHVRSPRLRMRVDTLIGLHSSGNFAWTSVVWVHRLAG
ncbi:type II secretion system minor pseudopilin GspK [Paraburkholderia sp. ZP32-5]|uniref:type II secretion system minor pseudopilin GspK n=1 Tax=Paraburkholderia sp. ZP32-5 TaxID=2883245 RepID=UPI002DD4366B|nr:type II secretion system minor pseudopilin GspK [Paraburkholderia sp. ZP32-5]